jgi:hypothetical protein
MIKSLVPSWRTMMTLLLLLQLPSGDLSGGLDNDDDDDDDDDSNSCKKIEKLKFKPTCRHCSLK